MSRSQKRDEGWIIFYKDNGEEHFRVRIPPHVTAREAEEFVVKMAERLRMAN